MLVDMLAELRYRVRSLARARLFSIVVVMTLSLGIGAATAVFSLIDGILLRPLPFPNEDRLVWIGELFNRSQVPGSVCYRTFAEIRDNADSFAAVALGRAWSPAVESEQNAELLAGYRVSHSYFTAMGVAPVLGRFFRSEDDRPGAAKVVVLSYDSWRHRFGGDPTVIGRPIRLGGESFEIVGVAPPAATYARLGWGDIWTPLQVDDARERTNIGRNSLLVARLEDGRLAAEASAEVITIVNRLATAYPDTHYPGDSAVVLHSREVVVGASRATLFTLFGAVALLLLVSSANVANLLLTRATSRHQEIAVRAALGAGRARLVSEFVVEGLLLALGGAAVGTGIAWGATRALIAVNPIALPRLDTIGFDLRTLLFSAAAATVTGIAVAILAGVRLTERDITENLKDSGRASTAAPNTRRLHRALVVAEIAAALVLIVGMALLVRSFDRLLSVPVGFDGDDALTMRITLPAAIYDAPEKRAAFFQRVLASVQEAPGVALAGMARLVPLVPRSTSDSIVVEGRPMPQAGEPALIVRENVVSRGYFRAIGIPIVRGRDFTGEETWLRGGAIIINQALADRLFPNEDPIGRRVTTGFEWRTGYTGQSTLPWFTIVGIVGNAVQRTLEHDIASEMFHPYINPYNVARDGSTTLVVRGRRDAVPAIRAALAKVDPAAAISDIASADEIAGRALAPRRSSLFLFVMFAGAATLIAAVGVYGSMAHAASQRQREIGVRLSMGARGADVRWLFLSEAAMLTLTGIAIGTAAALALGNWMSSLLFDVQPWDPLAFGAGAVTVATVALVASVWPAVRASRVDPIELFR